MSEEKDGHRVAPLVIRDICYLQYVGRRDYPVNGAGSRMAHSRRGVADRNTKPHVTGTVQAKQSRTETAIPTCQKSHWSGVPDFTIRSMQGPYNGEQWVDG